MLRRFDDIEDPQEISSIVQEPLEYKLSSQIAHKQNDSFDSSFFVKHGSDSSFISQISYEEGPKSKLSTYQIVKNPQVHKSFTSESSILRPMSILKTTFLSEDAANYNFPKKMPTKNPNPIRTITESSEKTDQSLSKSKEISDEKSELFEKINNLENTILKKDALIETLRGRVGKMVQELEETHRRVALAKNNLNEDYILKIQQLTKKCEDYENGQEKENFMRKDQERDVRMRNSELESKVRELEKMLKKGEDSKGHVEKMNENLKLKLENADKALDMAVSHKKHLEQEVIRLEVVKRTYEHEMKVVAEENQKNVASLSKKLEETAEEARFYQQQTKETGSNYDTLNKNHSLLSSKLLTLEEKLNQLDSLKFPEANRTKFSQNESKIIKDLDSHHFTFHDFQDSQMGLQRNCNHHRKSKSISASFRTLVKEIMEILGVSNVFEIVPVVKNLFLSQKEKKLVKKMKSLVKECFSQDRLSRDITPAHVWKCIKRIFEDYANLKKLNSESEIKLIKQYLGENNIGQKIAGLCQELKMLHGLTGKIKNKYKLPASASIHEMELALNGD